MSDSIRRMITRRDFLTKAAVGATLISALPILSACGSQAAPPAATQAPAKVAEPTKAPEKAAEATKAPEKVAEPTKAPEPTKAEAAAKSFKDVKIVGLYQSGGKTADDLNTEISKDLLEKTGIVLENQTLPFEKLMDKEMTLIAAKSGDIDLFNTHYAQIGRFYDSFVPLNDFADRDGIKSADYSAGSFDAFSNDKGKLLAIPLAGDLRALIYRTDLFEKAGVKAPPTTWEELVDIGKKTNNPPDTFGYLTVGKGDPALREFSDLLWENGTDFLEGGLKPSKPSWNSAEGVEALQWWYDLVYTNKISPPGTASYGWEELVQLFSAGQGAMEKWWNTGSFEDATQSKIMGKYAVAPITKRSPKTKTTMVCHGRAINPFSKNVDASWEAIKVICGKDGQLKMFKIAGNNPSQQAALEEAKNTATGTAKAFLETCLAESKYGYTWPLFPAFSEIQPILWGEIEKCLSDQKKPKEALDFAAAEAIKIMQREKLI